MDTAHPILSWAEDADGLSVAIPRDTAQLPVDRPMANRFWTGLAKPDQENSNLTDLVDDELLDLLAVNWSGKVPG